MASCQVGAAPKAKLQQWITAAVSTKLHTYLGV